MSYSARKDWPTASQTCCNFEPRHALWRGSLSLVLAKASQSRRNLRFQSMEMEVVLPEFAAVVAGGDALDTG